MQHAKEVYAENNKYYRQEVIAAAAQTKIYLENTIFVTEDQFIKPEFEFSSATTTEAIRAAFDEHGGEDKIAALNFASYKHPGGMFMNGSNAQEECLCHESTLYNVLKSFDQTYYEKNRAKGEQNRGLYKNRGLYSPNIIFKDDPRFGDDIPADVITVAAPNWGTADGCYLVSAKENEKAVVDRIKFIKDIAEDNGVMTLIAGAFGCGVFRQDPHFVASAFEKVFSKSSCIRKIIFAVPGDPRRENPRAFREMVLHHDVKEDFI